MLDEFYTAFKLHLLRKLSNSLHNLAQRLTLLGHRIDWYTYSLEPHPNDVLVTNILTSSTKKSLTRKKTKRTGISKASR